MTRTLCGLALSLLLLVPAVSHAAGGEITIETRDGQTVHGDLVAETERGFLVALPDKTVLVEYAQVKTLQRGPGSAPTVSAPASEPRSASGGTDLGIGFGPLYGPTLNERSEHRFYVLGPALQLPIELRGDRVGVRFTPTLTFAWVGGSDVWRRFGELTVDTQLRIYVSRAYSVGIGAFAGGGISSSGLAGVSGYGGYGVVGPSITPVDLRFGDTRQHELQLWVGLAIDFGNGGSGLDTTRPELTYAYHF